MSDDPRATVLYDEDCGFCRWSADVLRRWDRSRRLRFAPIQGPEGAVLLEDLDPSARLASWHLVTADARRVSGGAAIEPLLRRLPGGRPLAVLASLVPTLTEALYRAVAKRRTLIGRVIGATTCEGDPSRAGSDHATDRALDEDDRRFRSFASGRPPDTLGVVAESRAQSGCTRVGSRSVR